MVYEETHTFRHTRRRLNKLTNKKLVEIAKIVNVI